jgi:hypothetical protein
LFVFINHEFIVVILADHLPSNFLGCTNAATRGVQEAEERTEVMEFSDASPEQFTVAPS